MANIQIKERKIVELHPHPKNEGIYGDEDIEQLAQDTALASVMRYTKLKYKYL